MGCTSLLRLKSSLAWTGLWAFSTCYRGHINSWQHAKFSPRLSITDIPFQGTTFYKSKYVWVLCWCMMGAEAVLKLSQPEIVSSTTISQPRLGSPEEISWAQIESGNPPIGTEFILPEKLWIPFTEPEHPLNSRALEAQRKSHQCRPTPETHLLKQNSSPGEALNSFYWSRTTNITARNSKPGQKVHS
jgi:hypothetical protein